MACATETTASTSSPEHSLTEAPGRAALLMYCQGYKQAKAHAADVAIGLHRDAFPWHAKSGEDESTDDESDLEVREQLKHDISVEPESSPWTSQGTADSQENVQLHLCKQCGLPLGDLAYGDEFDPECGLAHGECMAQLMLRNLKQEQTEQERRGAERKRAVHRQYDIGWKTERVPRNSGPARRLKCCPVPDGMCCLVLDGDSRSVRLAPTAEPAAAVNLEYLSTALRVRKYHGREPMFSLDPVVSKCSWREPMQEKRFEPDWLVGTSVGDVLFQSDFHLKELSIGECKQPVVGMKSCADFFEEEGCATNWRARAWFVVKHAAVQVSQDNALVPCIRMAVEAREQIQGDHGLEDKKTTRPTHPLVKYAETFSHNFDLIAERKSVIHHLREVAKAAVLAKFLLELEIKLGESWFELADEPAELCALEVPQLWNYCFSSRIQMKDGKILNADSGFDSGFYSLYGGVQFGLDRFQFCPDVREAGAVPARYLSASLAARKFSESFRPVLRFSDSFRPVETPQGVDLNLDSFSLASISDSREGKVLSAEPCTRIGSAFWSSLSGNSEDVFDRENKSLLRSIFNPQLSDRREDGDVFAPPDRRAWYMQKLRHLVRAEEVARQDRKAQFRSAAFDPSVPGPLFPFWWKARQEIARKDAPAKVRTLRQRPDYKSRAHMFDSELKCAVPVFDNSTEEGLRFRIYRFGSLEVRTTQEPEGKEAVIAVFSLAAAARSSAGNEQRPLPEDTRKLTRVTEYVERATNGRGRHSYLVFEGERGSLMLTERLEDGTVRGQEDPTDLEDRNSLAKVIRSAECSMMYATVRNLMAFGEEEVDSTAYAQATYCRAVGRCRTSGFRMA